VAVLHCAAAGFKQSSWSGITYYTRNMPHSNAGVQQQQQQQLEREISPPPHARQQWYEQAAGEASRQGQEGPDVQESSSSSSSEAGSDVPFVLLHGIGMGLIPYISLLFNMAATGEG
jgi:hypothetical protein